MSDLCSAVAWRSLKHSFRASDPIPSVKSWQENRNFLMSIPAGSEEQELLNFLEKRWLAKSSGFHPILVDWLGPSFGISTQVNPDMGNSYARDPAHIIYETYRKRVHGWKQSLPHPAFFPLILTRPFDLQKFLPRQCIDLTGLFSDNPNDWMPTWEKYRSKISFSPEAIYIQRLKQGEIGGIRILPLTLSPTLIEHQHRFLLEWVSKLGISANRIELDRNAPRPLRFENSMSSLSPKSQIPLQEIVDFLQSFEKSWRSTHPQKTLMVEGTLHVLNGFFKKIGEKKKSEISPTKSAIAEFSTHQIIAHLRFLDREAETLSFYDVAGRLEQIHAHLSALLEIFSPYQFQDFSPIYNRLLQKSIPEKLQSLASYTLHTSGMTSLTGIMKAVEASLGRAPSMLLGENIYFEVLKAANLIGKAILVDHAKINDWEDVDLILAQFNPPLRRIDLPISEYQEENVAQIVRKAIDAKEGRPLTIALDCTLDYIDSPRVSQFLATFQDEIESGALNVICYRSGLKYDLFGMDNYCGAPFCMFHSREAKWSDFDRMIHDPVLLTDRLSVNWFCLAYQFGSAQLEAYRKTIFDNTRALLKRIPNKLLSSESLSYRVVPMKENIDASFIDIKTEGPFHAIKAGIFAGLLTIRCMEEKHPMFYRSSIGFYHPNLTLLVGEKNTTIRLLLGLDPAQVDVLAECFEKMNSF